MATRRVKRSKKQVHRAHGRKTNRHRKTKRHSRITRRHQGGMLKSFAKLFTKKMNEKGGPLYDGIEVFSPEDNAFHIGNQRLDAYDASSNPNDKVYADKIRFYLKAADIRHSNDMIVLDQTNFDKFVRAFASNTFNAPSAVASGASGASGASAAAPVVPKMSLNELMVSSGIIAFKNNNGVVVHYPADKSKTEYEFDNFIITIRADEYDQPDHIISGKLTVKFVPGPPLVTEFTLELNVDHTDALIACMKKSGTGFVTIDNIASSKSFFGASKMVITGTLMEQKDDRLKKSTYDLNSFVMNLATHYKECSDLATQMAKLRVAGPADVARVIGSKIAMLEKRLSTMSAEEKTRFEALRQQFREAGNNLALLEQISTGMDQLADARRGRIYPASVTAGGKTRRKNRIRMHRH